MKQSERKKISLIINKRFPNFYITYFDRKTCVVLTPFFLMLPFDPPKNIRKSEVFCFQGDQKGILGRKVLIRLYKQNWIKSELALNSEVSHYAVNSILNTENWIWKTLRIHSKYGKIRTRKTSNTDTFHAVLSSTEIYVHGVLPYSFSKDYGKFRRIYTWLLLFVLLFNVV